MINTQKRHIYFLLLLFLTVRLLGIGTDISNSDAARWHRRSEKFLTAIKEFNFEQTYQHYQPGVSLMWLNSVVKQVGFTAQEYYSKYFDSNYEIKTLENSNYYPIIHGASKVTLILILCLLLYYQAILITRLTSETVSLVYVLLVSVEPYIVGIDRYFHLTSLETYTAFAAILSLIVYKKDYIKYNKHIYYSAILFSVSVLTKVSTLILVPLIVFILLPVVIKEKKYFSIAKFSVTFLLITLIFFPALWVAPIQTIQKILFAIFNAVEGDARGTVYTGIYSFLFYPIIFVLKTSPITLVLFIAALLNIKKIKDSYLFNIVFLYILCYLAAFTISDQKIDRYLVSVLLPIMLICAYFLVFFAKKYLKTTVIFCVSFFVYVSYVYFPVYSAYYSPIILSDIFVANSIFYDNSGEFFAQAAFYLNTKDRDNVIYIPYNVETFSHYSKSKVSSEYVDNFNYLVFSKNNLKKVSNIINDNNCIPDTTFGSKLNAIVYVYKCNFPR